MLKGLKVTSLACKCAFYRPKQRELNFMELNFEDLLNFEMQK